MPQYDGYLVFDTAVDQTGLQKGLKESESLFSVFGGNFLANLASQTFNQTMSAAKGFITQGVGLASDLGEIKNVVDVTFGSASETIYKWAKDAKENYGYGAMSANEYYKGFMEERVKLSATMKTDVLGEKTRDLRSFGYSASSSQSTVTAPSIPTVNFSSQPMLTQVTNDIILDGAKIGKSVTEWQLTQQIITGG
jgi:hypothetical protein